MLHAHGAPGHREETVAATALQPTHGSSHLPALDGLRGVAILLVVLHHFAFYGGFQPAGPVDRLVGAVAYAGWTGVDLFFVLSGFLITRILYTADREKHYFRNFYARRVLRIFPLYYATLAFFFLVGPSLGVPSRGPIADQAWYWTYAVNVRIATAGWPKINELAHFWSLAIEEQFYLVWPLLIFFLGRASLIRLCVVMIGASLAVRLWLAVDGQSLAAFVLAQARLDSLAAGALLALLASENGGLRPWRRTAGLVAGTALALLAALAFREGGLWTEDALTISIGLTLLAILFASMVTLTLTAPASGNFARFMTSVPMQSLGRYSYGLYVLHHPIAIGMSRFMNVADVPTLFGSSVPALGVYVLVGGGISFAAAALSWHAFERHFLRLKERFR
jgi:peptidoglycan/LPS O-acetylase OafA/YrhL